MDTSQSNRGTREHHYRYPLIRRRLIGVDLSGGKTDIGILADPRVLAIYPPAIGFPLRWRGHWLSDKPPPRECGRAVNLRYWNEHLRLIRLVCDKNPVRHNGLQGD